jgi:hypothetical protein
MQIALKLRRNRIEGGRKIVSDRAQHGYGGDGDQRGDQAVFNRSSTASVFHQRSHEGIYHAIKLADGIGIRQSGVIPLRSCY